MFDLTQITQSVSSALNVTKPVVNDINENSEINTVSYTDFHSLSGISKVNGVAEIDETIKAIEAIKSNDDHDLDDIYRFNGFGAIRDVFDEKNTAHDQRREKLSKLLTREEIEQAKRASLTSFFTDSCITKPLWSALKCIKFSHARVLEPSCGVGRFIAPIPNDMRQTLDLTLIELDSVSYQACEKLYPNALLLNNEYQEAKLNTVDLVVSNPPFNSILTSDRSGLGINNVKLHELFVLKSLKLLREGGYLYVVLPTTVMDEENTSFRKSIGELANLVGGVRIPYQLFEKKTNTKMAVDVLLFKRVTTKTLDQSWIEAEEKTCGSSFYSVNKALDTDLFVNLASAKEDYLFNKKSVLWTANNVINLESEIENACFNLFKNENEYIPHTHDDELIKANTNFSISSNIEPFNYGLTDHNEIVYRTKNNFELIESSMKAMKHKRISGMITIANLAKKLTSLEASNSSSITAMEQTRTELNNVYDQYVKKYGFLTNRANSLAFGRDARIATLYALESNYKAGISKQKAKSLGVAPVPDQCTKSKIFEERAFLPWSIPEKASSTEDALALSLAYKGVIDFELIAKLTGLPERAARGELVGKSVFYCPDAQNFLLAEDYLAGDLVKKIAIAEKLEEADTRMAANIQALKAALPDRVCFSDIKAAIGSHWLPESLLEDFISTTFKLRADSVSVSRYLGRTTLTMPAITDPEVQSTYGTDTHTVKQVLNKALNNGDLIVKIRDTNGKVIGTDNEASTLLKAAVKEIEMSWLSFIDSNKNSQIVEENYNKKMNRFASFKAKFKRGYFPDLNPNFKPYPHQIAAIRRYLSQTDHGFLVNSTVGSGKTGIMAIAAHESVRLGLRKRVALVCPAHLTAQIAKEWLSLYPSDSESLLVLDAQSLSPKQRIETLERIKTSGINYVIIPEPTFKKINAPISSQEHVLNNRKAEVEQSLLTAEERYTVRELENAKVKIEEQLKKLSKLNDIERSLCFESLDFQGLMLDEAHRIKNMGYQTAYLKNCRGLGTTEPSQRSLDIQMKVDFLIRKYKNSGVLMATGTAISNSIVESYGWLRCIAPKLLESSDISCLDDFARTFVTVSSEYELKADGSVGLVNRIRAFANLEQLTAMFGAFSITVTSDELEHLLPTIQDPEGNKYPARPPLATGGPISVVCNIDDETKIYMDFLVERAKNYKNSPIPQDNALLLIADAKKASVSSQLVNAASENPMTNKVIKMIENTTELYNKFSEEKGVQLLYVDIGTYDKKKDAEEEYVSNLRSAAKYDEFAQAQLDDYCQNNRGVAINLYRHIIDKLVDNGIPRNEIAIVQEYDTDAKKAALYEKLRQGVIRVAITSVEKLSTGANIQDRIVGTHVLVPPFKPSDLEQLRGRSERIGNVIYANRVKTGEQKSNPFELSTFYYAMECTTDSWLFQILENKASMIKQFTSGNDLSRSLTLDKDVLSFAELKAQVSGNQALLELMSVERDLFDQQVTYRNIMRSKHNALKQIELHNETISSIEQAIIDCKSDFTDFKECASKGLTLKIGDNDFKEVNQDVSEMMFLVFADIRRKSKMRADDRTFKIGSIGNFDILSNASSLAQH
ncbi:hypothetical protein UA32_11875 [Photobacterium angustum]|uniref:DEAD/DEAH box helicase family protein n=1 Tax=Photobacterium angustum TaxID=661 RepID=UPI0005E167DD|nr:DEAD/DEAH box helicase family protein [Photobacterium angustum]KJG37658.1 hypothetical protein UA32_11875 [Photobacterium angustum]